MTDEQASDETTGRSNEPAGPTFNPPVDPRIDRERLERGRQVFTEVYGSDTLLPPIGANMPADMMLSQAFAEIWSRDELPIPSRRLLVIGVLAANNEAAGLQVQLERALDAGELTEGQLDEVVLHLAHYLGWPRMGMMSNAAIEAKKAVRRANTAEATGLD
jgi:4-carboxymuconolactone decarboxylase